MTFAHPWMLLWILLACGVFFALYRAIERRRVAQTLAYSNLEFMIGAIGSRTKPARLLFAGWIVAIALIALALARPSVYAMVPAKDGAAIICIDTSGSMAATDVLPTRSQAAKAAAQAFIKQTPTGTKVGIIAFSTSASVIQPLTDDRDQLTASLANVPDPNGATAIGDALALAAGQLPSHGHRVVVLITDGVSNRGVDPLEVAKFLGSRHVPVYTIGIGTNNGEIIPGTSEAATIDEDALRMYAQASGGAYARVSNAGELRSALADLGRTTTLQRKKIDASLPTAILGGILMAATLLIGLAAGRYP
ncbi:MAG: VWA domain-containing protein [Candidatus Eremiobacteraeota bacterium]|nr:VWA domain-containing protein [Candidatus Eremiobacteraeota bacterium]